MKGLPQRDCYVNVLRVESGVLVTAIEPSSPAAQSGLCPGDVIVGYGAAHSGAIDDLYRLLTDEQVGALAHLTVLRGVERLAKWYARSESDDALSMHQALSTTSLLLYRHHCRREEFRQPRVLASSKKEEKSWPRTVFSI